jgi:DNA-binding MarR family transcriptional regulator
MQLLQDTTIMKALPADCAQEVLTTVPAVMRFIRQQMRRHRQAELTVPQFRTLVVLSRSNDTSLSALAEHLGLSLPAASRMVELLVKRGLMQRQTQSKDRRRVSLSLTRQGRETFQRALDATQIALTTRLKTLTHPDIAQIRAAMRILSRVFDLENGRQDPMK